MITLSEINHHASILVSPSRDSVSESLWKELQSDSVAHVFHNQTVIDIDTARALISWANTPYEGNKTALVSFHTITIPAQNALLKILEEPHTGVQFILITTNKESLIPTLYSRLREYFLKDIDNDSNADALIFLTTQHGQRMKLPYIEKLLKAVDEEGRKDREGVRNFILTLVKILEKEKKSSSCILETIQMASYAADPSASGKALIEYLALYLPQVKA